MSYYDVLVTGGSRGIGSAIVQRYEELGYSVLAPSRSDLDLRSRESIMQFIERYRDNHFSILVNNAGSNDINMLENITEQNIEDMISINLKAPLYLIQGFVPGMKAEQFGRIINISSVWSVVSKPGRTVYSATKHGIHGLTVTMALELAKDGILVNTIAPGFTMTELTKKNNSVDEICEMAKTVPVGRLAEPKEIANVVCYFGSRENTYVTGQKIVVDGGFSVQ